MKKWLIALIMVCVMIPLVTAICCERGTDCIISETCQDGNCGNCSIAIYNRGGTVNISHSLMTAITSYTYTENISTNLPDLGTYPYTINCTTVETCQGDCQVEVKSECGEEGKGNMFAGIGILLLGVTIIFVLFAIKSQQQYFQIGFALLTFFMIIVDFRFASMMIAEIAPTATGMIHNMDTMYNIGIIMFRWLFGIALIFLLYIGLNIFWAAKKKKVQKLEESFMTFGDGNG